MENEIDFIRLLVISRSIDELVETLKSYQKDGYNIINFEDGKEISITTILDEIQSMMKDYCDYEYVAIELVDTYCTMLNYLY